MTVCDASWGEARSVQSVAKNRASRSDREKLGLQQKGLVPTVASVDPHVQARERDGRMATRRVDMSFIVYDLVCVKFGIG